MFKKIISTIIIATIFLFSFSLTSFAMVSEEKAVLLEGITQCERCKTFIETSDEICYFCSKVVTDTPSLAEIEAIAQRDYVISRGVALAIGILFLILAAVSIKLSVKDFKNSKEFDWVALFICITLTVASIILMCIGLSGLLQIQ